MYFFSVVGISSSFIADSRDNSSHHSCLYSNHLSKSILMFMLIRHICIREGTRDLKGVTSGVIGSNREHCSTSPPYALSLL